MFRRARGDEAGAGPPVEAEGSEERTESISNPAELIRLASMLQALMVEAQQVDLDADDAVRRRLFDIQHRAVESIKELVSDDLDDELTQLGLPVEDADASGAELRIAHAQLVGWMNGLFQGIQAAMFARQAIPPEQLKELQRQLAQRSESSGPPGQYL